MTGARSADCDGEKSLVERRFEFGLVKQMQANGETKWVALPPVSRNRLNARLASLRSVALKIRRSDASWRAQGREKIESAEKKVEYFAKMFRENVDKELTVLSQNAEVANGEENKIGGEIQKVVDISRVCTAIVEGRPMVEKAKVELRRLKEAGDAFPDERRKLFDQLTEEQVLLKNLGDALDVNVRELPLVWTSNIDWMLTSWRENPTIVTCPMCNKNVIESALLDGTHTEGTKGKGLALAGAAAEGSGMGGSTRITCALPVQRLMMKTQCCMSLFSRGYLQPDHSFNVHVELLGSTNVLQPDRDPWSHNVIERLYALTKYDDVHATKTADVATLNKEDDRIDGHASGEVWVPDKQGSFCLFDFVKYAGPSPHRRSGVGQTLRISVHKSMRSFRRPALGVPLAGEGYCFWPIFGCCQDPPSTRSPKLLEFTYKRTSRMWDFRR